MFCIQTKCWSNYVDVSCSSLFESAGWRGQSWASCQKVCRVVWQQNILTLILTTKDIATNFWKTSRSTFLTIIRAQLLRQLPVRQGHHLCCIPSSSWMLSIFLTPYTFWHFTFLKTIWTNLSQIHSVLHLSDCQRLCSSLLSLSTSQNNKQKSCFDSHAIPKVTQVTKGDISTS